MFGINTAAWICVIMIDAFQVGVAGYLMYIHQNIYAAMLLLLVIPQITCQNDVKSQSSAQPFRALGILVTGLALERR